MLVSGGYVTNVNGPPGTKSAELYLAQSRQWVNAPDMPAAHANHTGVTLADGSVMVIGGFDGNGYQNEADIFTFSPVAPYGGWRNAGNFATYGRAAPATLLPNGAVLLASGTAGVAPYGNPATGVSSTEADLYDPSTGSWKQTTAQAVAHDSGGAESISYNGTTTTVVFGGIWGTAANTVITNVSEIFTLTSGGQPCTNNAECAVGTCSGGVCVPPGYPVRIDATALSHKGLLITGSAYQVLDTTQPRQVRLPQGTYTLEVYKGLESVATFTVNSSGTVAYDPSLEGILSGSGTTTLKVNGRPITVDARGLSQRQMQLLAYHYNQGVEVDNLPFSTGYLQNYVLLPLQGFGYQFNVDGSHVAAVSFNIDLAGNVHVPSAQQYLIEGEGTNTLTLGGVHINLTIPAGLGDGSLDGGFTIREGQASEVFVLPYSDGSPLTLTIGSNTTTFNVTPSGDITGDPELIYILQAHGDGNLFCSAENTVAEQNAWTLTPLGCRGVARADGSKTIDAALPVANPIARLRGPGRVLNELPRFRKAAGGDPVMGDGEFFLQRVDAALGGYGIQYQFRRTYRSGLEVDGPLGVGWDHNYNQQIFGMAIYDPQAPNFDPTTAGDIIGPNCDGTIQLRDGEGNLQLFTAQGLTAGGGGVLQHFTPQTRGATLDHILFFNGTAASYWRLNYPDGTVSVFDRAGFLKSITDPAGNALTFTWDRATAPSPPQSNCAATGYQSVACATWLTNLTQSPIGQRRRLASVTDASRTVHYIYSQQDLQKLSPNDRLQCISTDTNCGTAGALASFTYDPNSRLSSVFRGQSVSSPIESYNYHAFVTDAQTCIPNADLGAYCHRLCFSPSEDCRNLNYEKTVTDTCFSQSCVPGGKTAASCADLGADFAVEKPAGYPRQPGEPSVLCCTASTSNTLSQDCAQFMWGPGSICVEGCWYAFQCQETRNNTLYAIYAGGLASELNNDITDVKDSQGNVVVHNDYGEDRTLVSFDKVTTQTITSTSTDNVISFEYHDLIMEAAGLTPAPIYTPPSGGLPQWTAPFSKPDGFGTVQRFQLKEFSQMKLCPRKCPTGSQTCPAYDYDPAFEDDNVEPNPEQMTAAVLIHDLHGLTRIQYLDAKSEVVREVTVDTNEITDYNYDGGLLTGVRQSSGVRTCIERDSMGRPTQSSLVPAPNFPGTAITQATMFAYYPNGQIEDISRNALDVPVKTHYERDPQSGLVKRVDQDVKLGTLPLQTFYAYDGERPAKGILETPTQITYPNKRIDKFSSFDASMGGPQTIVIDSTNATPESRYVKYDSFGRVAEEGEQGRFARRYQYLDANDIWRLSSTGHRQDPSQAWVDVPIASHMADGKVLVDSIVEPTRTTNVTNVGHFPAQTDLMATAGPQNIALPAMQTSCYNYAPDGRLEAVILPEGNGLSYTYLYGVWGTIVTSFRGFGVDSSGAWAAGCRGRTAPANDPGRGRPVERRFKPGGFIEAEVTIIKT